MENILFLNNSLAVSLNGSKSFSLQPSLKLCFSNYLSAPPESKLIYLSDLSFVLIVSSMNLTEVTVL
jgi:hypothetical protein